MDETQSQSSANQFGYSSPQPGRKPKKFVYLLIFAILLVIAFTVQKFFFGANSQENTSAVTPSPTTEYQFPTDTPAPSRAPTNEPTKTVVSPTVKKVNPVDQSTGLDRSVLAVEIQNGSGETGAASKGSDILKGFGYKISATANADNFDYEDVTIQVKSTKSNFLALLKKDLGFSYTVGSASADLSSDFSADALVIIGK